ncbi:hypothetical protein [Pseudoxanthomonas suwonensis]|uniref:hypothetical protein n=1 Tax=Pseudoxanthomonas suwonensis TaxID=314722 RepID=UPI00048E6F57|nr:hypothetical protein [Pseudoxanthomonas suwonensis]
MGPRAEFILSATLSGAVVALLGYAVASWMVFEQTPAEIAGNGARWCPSGALAALPAAWLVSAWQARAERAGRRWSARGMALRGTGLALLLYPLAVVAWVLATGAVDQQLASGGVPLRELAPWLPSIVFGATLAALLVGTWPAFFSAFVLCRRYLRRRGGSTTDIA